MNGNRRRSSDNQRTTNKKHFPHGEILPE